MRYLHTSDYISLHDFVLCWLIPNNEAASIIFLANTKSVWKKKGVLVLDRMRSKRSKARAAKLSL